LAKKGEYVSLLILEDEKSGGGCGFRFTIDDGEAFVKKKSRISYQNWRREKKVDKKLKSMVLLLIKKNQFSILSTA
jgi:hypothetical protein